MGFDALGALHGLGLMGHWLETKTGKSSFGQVPLGSRLTSHRSFGYLEDVGFIWKAM